VRALCPTADCAGCLRGVTFVFGSHWTIFIIGCPQFVCSLALVKFVVLSYTRWQFVFVAWQLWCHECHLEQHIWGLFCFILLLWTAEARISSTMLLLWKLFDRQSAYFIKTSLIRAAPLSLTKRLSFELSGQLNDFPTECSNKPRTRSSSIKRIQHISDHQATNRHDGSWPGIRSPA